MSGLEVVGVVASILQIAEVGTELSVKLCTFYRTVKGANRSLQGLSSDVSLTCSILNQLGRALEQDDQAKICSQQAFGTAQEVLGECKAVFQQIETAIEKYDQDAETNRFRRGARRITAAFMGPNLDVLKNHLERLKTTTLLMLHVIMYAGQLRKRQAKSALRERGLIHSLLNEKGASDSKRGYLSKSLPSVDADEEVPINQESSRSVSSEQHPASLPRELKEYYNLIRTLLHDIDAFQQSLDHGRHRRIRNGIIKVHSAEAVLFRNTPYGPAAEQLFDDSFFKIKESWLRPTGTRIPGMSEDGSEPDYYDPNYNSDDSMIHVRKETRDAVDHPHNRRLLAEGPLIEASAVAELVREQRKRQDYRSRSRRRRSRRRRRSSRSSRSERSYRYRHRSGSRHSRSRGRSRSSFRPKTQEEAGLGAAALAYARRRRWKENKYNWPSSRSRPRSRSPSYVVSGEFSDGSDKDDSRSRPPRRRHMAGAALAGPAAAGLVERSRSRSRPPRSRSRLRKAIPIVGAGGGVAAATGLYEKRKAGKDGETPKSSEQSRSRSRGSVPADMDPDGRDMYPDPTRDSGGLIEYGDNPVHGRMPISEYSQEYYYYGAHYPESSLSESYVPSPRASSPGNESIDNNHGAAASDSTTDAGEAEISRKRGRSESVFDSDDPRHYSYCYQAPLKTSDDIPSQPPFIVGDLDEAGTLETLILKWTNLTREEIREDQINS